MAMRVNRPNNIQPAQFRPTGQSGDLLSATRAYPHLSKRLRKQTFFPTTSHLKARYEFIKIFFIFSFLLFFIVTHTCSVWSLYTKSIVHPSLLSVLTIRRVLSDKYGLNQHMVRCYFYFRLRIHNTFHTIDQIN